MSDLIAVTSDPLLQEIRERRQTASTEWDAIIDEAKKDRLCVAGKPWEALDPEGVKERKETKRPYLALDELGQYINQTVNDVRANPRGIKFAPTGNGANDKGAELYQNHTREIEYRSHARVGYSTAFESAVTSSYGWIRIRTKREHIRTFNQDLWIEPIVNPDQVLPDPNATWPDSRDMKYLFYIEPWTKAEFQRAFPKAKITDFSLDLRNIAQQWVTDKNLVQVAEYWKVDAVTRRLVAYRARGGEDGSEQFALLDELPGGKLPAGMENVREEEVEDSTVKSYLTNGLEILEENDWKGKYIPFVSCFGKVLYVDDGSGSRRKLLSMTRLARDPYMLHCYIATCKAEAIGGVPRSSWIGYEGQFAKPERWQRANREPISHLEAKVTVEGAPPGQVLPLPTKQSWDPPIQNLEIAQESARRAIQAAMGISPLPTPMQRQNQKSGKAMERIESSQQRGSFHFVDHYELMIERAGVIIEDLLDKVIDTARDIAVRLPNDKATVQRVNDPRDPQSITTKGDYRVTISTGPATDSQRAASDEYVDSMVSNIGVIAQIAGPEVAKKVLAKGTKLKQLGPEGDEIVELLDPTPPDGQDVPPEVQALQQELQQAQQQLQQAGEIIKSDVHKEQTKIEGQGRLQAMKLDFEREKLSFEREKLQRESETKITVAELGAKIERLTLFLEERARLGLQAHESALAAADADQARQMAQMGHDQALEQGEQGQAFARESSMMSPETAA